MRPRRRPQVDRRSADRTGIAGPRRAGQPGRLLGVCLLLLRCRQRAGGTWSCLGCRNGAKARSPRVHCHVVPGRRRPGGHRHSRNHSCRQPRRKHLRVLRQQLHLRHDGRPIGAHHAGWAVQHHFALGTSPRQRRTAIACRRTAGFVANSDVHRARRPQRHEERNEGQEGHQESSADPEGWRRLLLG